MRLGVVGSRAYRDLSEVREYVREWATAIDPSTLTLFSGGARGVDSEAEWMAEKLGVRVVSFRPVRLGTRFGVVRLFFHHQERFTAQPGATYPSFGDAAGARNTMIVEAADKVVAFWDGRSTGTRGSIEKAQAAGKLLNRDRQPA